jgi:hypothetical protein
MHVSLSPRERNQLRALWKTYGEHALAERFQLNRATLAKALAGIPIRRSTRALVVAQINSTVELGAENAKSKREGSVDSESDPTCRRGSE